MNCVVSFSRMAREVRASRTRPPIRSTIAPEIPAGATRPIQASASHVDARFLQCRDARQQRGAILRSRRPGFSRRRSRACGTTEIAGRQTI